MRRDSLGLTKGQRRRLIKYSITMVESILDSYGTGDFEKKVRIYFTDLKSNMKSKRVKWASPKWTDVNAFSIPSVPIFYSAIRSRPDDKEGDEDEL